MFFLTRHETGHNMGFGHQFNCTLRSAMIPDACGLPPAYDLDYLIYTLHDIAHLNDLY